MHVNHEHTLYAYSNLKNRTIFIYNLLHMVLAFGVFFTCDLHLVKPVEEFWHIEGDA